MQVSVESGNGLERRMTVMVEENRISDAVDKRLKDMTKTVKLDGFRKGKVPLKIIKQHYGSQVRNEVIGEVVQSTYYEAIQSENLQPAGMPSIDTKNLDNGLEFTATFEVYPEIELASLDKASVEVSTCEIADTDIDDMIDTIRKQNTLTKQLTAQLKMATRLTSILPVPLRVKNLKVALPKAISWCLARAK